MSKDNLVCMIYAICPFCDKIHSLEKRKRLTQCVIQDKIVDYEEIYYLCQLTDKNENEFVNAGLMDENLLRARNAYFERYGD